MKKHANWAARLKSIHEQSINPLISWAAQQVKMKGKRSLSVLCIGSGSDMEYVDKFIRGLKIQNKDRDINVVSVDPRHSPEHDAVAIRRIMRAGATKVTTLSSTWETFFNQQKKRHQFSAIFTCQFSSCISDRALGRYFSTSASMLQKHGWIIDVAEDCDRVSRKGMYDGKIYNRPLHKLVSTGEQQGFELYALKGCRAHFRSNPAVDHQVMIIAIYRDR